MSKGKYKIVTEEEFNQTKLMQQAGLTPPQVVKLTKRTSTPVNMMFRAATFEDYRLAVRLRYQKTTRYQQGHAKTESGGAHPEASSANHEMVTVLRSIDTSLKFLVEHLPIPEKRRLFR